MTRTTDDLRNAIRTAVGRHERIESTAFTKEALAAICEAVGSGIDGDFPPKSRMRATIRRELAPGDPDDADRPFRKAELQAIAAELEDDREQSGT